MQLSDEIIKVLEYLCEKIGVTIDWTNENILPYVGQLFEKFIKWEIGTSIAWIIITLIISTLVCLLFFKLSKIIGIDNDDVVFSRIVFTSCLIFLVTVIIGWQTFDIITCYTFPEKAIYDYIAQHLSSH